MNRAMRVLKQQRERQQTAEPEAVEESPFKPGTRRLKKGWKWVKGVPVRAGK